MRSGGWGAALGASLLLGAGGCLIPDFETPVAPMYCTGDSECPEGWFCYQPVRACASAGSDLEPPQVLRVDVEPEVVDDDEEVSVILEVDEPIAPTSGQRGWFYYADPSAVWIERPSPVHLDLTDVDEQFEGRLLYVYSFDLGALITPLPAGTHELYGDLRDGFGNRTGPVLLGTFTTTGVPSGP